MISLKKAAKDRSKRHGPKCVNCGLEPYDDTKTKEKLCVNCLRKLTRSSCFCCQKSFHVLSKAANLPRSLQLCEGCNADKAAFGEPKKCKICENMCAFEGPTCRTCTKSEKSFGPPVACEKCSKISAFNLTDKSKAKVGGRTLCYVCTQSVKLIAKKEAKIGKKSADVLKQLRAPGVHGRDRGQKDFSREAILEPIAMSTTTEDTHWEVLTEKFEILQRTFLEHKEQSETQIQQYIRKIFELRKELSEAQEAKDRAITKMHEKEREVGTLTGTVKQLENMAAFSLDQAKAARIEIEQKHVREVADLNKKIKFLENVTPQKMVLEAKLSEEKNSTTVSKGPDSFFGAPVALGSGTEPPRPKRTRPAAAPGEKVEEATEEKGKAAKKKKGATDAGEAKTKSTKDEKKIRKADKKERKRLKKEAKKRKLEGVPEGDEEEEEGVAAETAETSVAQDNGDEQSAETELVGESATGEAVESAQSEVASEEPAQSETASEAPVRSETASEEVAQSETAPEDHVQSETASEEPAEETAKNEATAENESSTEDQLTA